MNTRFLGLLLVPLLALGATHAHADAILVGSSLADKAGNFALEMQVDPNADPVYVADELKANVEMSSGSIKSVKVEDGLAHLSGEGATPGSEVQAMLNNDVALSTGVGASPAGIEYQRRAYWLLGGLGGLAALGGGGGGGSPAPLAEEPPPTVAPVIPPPPPAVLPTPTPPPVLSPGP